jgi:cytidine deaminase
MPILFKRCFFDAIRSGAKTATIRWWARPMVRAGALVAVPFLAGGRLLIDAVEPLASLAELTEADAVADGFASRPALLATLRAIYPELRSRARIRKPAGRSLFRVRFRFVARGE